MLKKYISLIIVIALCCSLAGCLSIDTSTDSTIINNYQGETQQETQSKIGSNDNLPQIEEQVIFENNELKITAVEFKYYDTVGAELKILIENNSDHDYDFDVEFFSVNNRMFGYNFLGTAPAGKKTTDSLYLSNKELALTEIAIEDIGIIEFVLKITDINADLSIESEPILIETNMASEVDDSLPDDLKTLFTSDEFDIYAKKINYTDEDFDPHSLVDNNILIVAKNKTDKNYTLDIRDLTINGFSLGNPSFYCPVSASHLAISPIYLSLSDFTDNKIEKIEKIEMRFVVETPWDHILVKSEMVTLE